MRGQTHYAMFGAACGDDYAQEQATVATGDLMLGGPTPGHASFVQKGIMDITGSVSSHVAPLVVDKIGQLRELNARPPHLGWTPLADRYHDWAAGSYRYMVLRPRQYEYATLSFVDADTALAHWRDKVSALCDLAADLELPYDVPALGIYVRNWVRRKLGLKPSKANVEFMVMCGEISALVMYASGVPVLDCIGGWEQQPSPAPIHFERAYGCGELVCVLDRGMKAAVDANLLRLGRRNVWA